MCWWDVKPYSINQSWNFMLDLEFFGMISRFTLKCQEKAPECLKYGKTIWRSGLRSGPLWGSLQYWFSQLTFYSKYSVDSSNSPWLWLHSIMSVSYLVTNADQMCLIFGCELWPKAPGKLKNWTGKLRDLFSSKRVQIPCDGYALMFLAVYFFSFTFCSFLCLFFQSVNTPVVISYWPIIQFCF